MPCTLPPELQLEIIDRVAGPPLSFPSSSSLRCLLALCLSSRALYALASPALYSAVTLPNGLSLHSFCAAGIPKSHTVRALHLTRQELHHPLDIAAAERLLLLLSPTLERLVFDSFTALSLTVDGLLPSLPVLREVAFTRQATQLLGLSPTYLELCPAVRRLALHDYWSDEYHVLRICTCFPNAEEFVLAADIAAQTLCDVLGACPKVKRVIILRPWGSPQEPKEARRALQPVCEARGLKIWEVMMPQEEVESLPRLAAEWIKDGTCWSLDERIEGACTGYIGPLDS